MIAWFVGEVARMKGGRRAILLFLAALAAVAGNFLRALVLTWATDAGGVDRLHAWHDPAGYIALACTLVVVAVLGWRWRSRHGGPAPASADGWPRLSWKQAGRALAALVFCIGVEAGVRVWFAGGGKPPAPAQGWVAQWPEGAEAFKRHPLDPYVKELLKPDTFASVSWRVPGRGERSAYYIGWDRGLIARNAPFIHSPEICLPMAGGKLIRRGEALTVRAGGLELPFEVYEFGLRGRLLHVFRVVWNPDEGRSAVPPAEPANRWEWLAQQWSIVAGRRITVRAQVLAFSMTGAADEAEARAIFTEEIATVVRTVAP
jgi:exosortase/archaeosortase family protein